MLSHVRLVQLDRIVLLGLLKPLFVRLEATQLFKKLCVRHVLLVPSVLKDPQLLLFALQDRSVLFQHLNVLLALKVIIVLKARLESLFAQPGFMQLLVLALAQHVKKVTIVVKVL